VQNLGGKNSTIERGLIADTLDTLEYLDSAMLVYDPDNLLRERGRYYVRISYWISIVEAKVVRSQRRIKQKEAEIDTKQRTILSEKYKSKLSEKAVTSAVKTALEHNAEYQAERMSLDQLEGIQSLLKAILEGFNYHVITAVAAIRYSAIREEHI